MKIASCKFATLIIIVPLLNLALDCHDAGTEPPIDTNRVKLTVIDAGVREAYLSLAIAQPAAAETILVQRNGVSILRMSTRSLSTTDTIFADTGLTENTAYSYQASLLWKGTTTVKSNPVQVQTLTPTSHSFTWQTFVLGGGDDSWLRDVTVIDDSNIYAVGEVSVRDSSGQVDPNPYNAVHWNGKDSQLVRIPTRIWNTNSYITGELKAIYSISSTNICVSTGGQVIWYDGQNWGGDQFLFTNLNDTTFGGITSFFGFSRSQIWGGR